MDWDCKGWGMDVKSVLSVVIGNVIQFNKSTITSLLYFSLHNHNSLLTMTNWCHLDLSSSFAVFPNLHLLCKLSAYILSDNYLSLLHCYKISGYVLSQSTVFIQHPLKCFLVFPKDLSFSSTYYLLLSYSILLSTQNYFLFLTLTKLLVP